MRWAWVARIDSNVVFGHRTIIKKFRYSPGHPDSGGAQYYLQEHWLAEGFGLIYKWQEPFDITYLRCCVIAGDTFGFVTSVKSISSDLPREYTLKQNYPNPFNPSTTIGYEIPRRTYVKLDVYNVLGQHIETLVEKEQDAGFYQIQFNASHLASGVFYYRLTAGGLTLTKKIVVAH